MSCSETINNTCYNLFCSQEANLQGCSRSLSIYHGSLSRAPLHHIGPAYFFLEILSLPTYLSGAIIWRPLGHLVWPPVIRASQEVSCPHPLLINFINIVQSNLILSLPLTFTKLISALPNSFSILLVFCEGLCLASKRNIWLVF